MKQRPLSADNAATYVGIMLVVAILCALSAWGPAALAVWKAALQ